MSFDAQWRKAVKEMSETGNQLLVAVEYYQAVALAYGHAEHFHDTVEKAAFFQDQSDKRLRLLGNVQTNWSVIQALEAQGRTQLLEVVEVVEPRTLRLFQGAWNADEDARRSKYGIWGWDVYTSVINACQFVRSYCLKSAEERESDEDGEDRLEILRRAVQREINSAHTRVFWMRVIESAPGHLLD